MQIKSVEFVKSSSKLQQCPDAILPEYAFIGRSNVGKSSLINAIASRKDLAKTSGTPGKTQLINHFIVDNAWFLTDLPGYGYAKVSKSLRKDFEKLIVDYILNRKNLVNLFLLIDVRHPPQKIDIDFIQWCGESSIPFSIIFTKADKLKQNVVVRNLEIYQSELLQFWDKLPRLFVTSAEKREGVQEILDFISEINRSIYSF